MKLGFPKTNPYRWFLSIISNPLVLIFIFYTLSFGLILLNSGIYWDGWVLFNAKPNIINQLFNELGSFWSHYFHNFIFSLPYPIFFYRLIIFLSYLLTSFLLFDLLKTIRTINDNSRLTITLLFALLPVNSARISIINTPYAVCYFIFFLSLWLFVKYINNYKILYRLMSLFLFFISFATQSLLVFYYAILIPYLIYVNKSKKNLKSYIYVFLAKLDFLLLPIIFRLFKTIFLSPQASYSGYNQITQYGLISAVTQTFTSFNLSFIEIISNSLMMKYSIIIVLLCFISCLLFIKKQNKKISNTYQSLKMFLTGCFIFYFGTYSYYVVGLSPNRYDWNSRHQLLTPLGACFMLYFGIEYLLLKLKINKIEIRTAIFLSLLLLFTYTNIFTYFSYLKDWYKQKAIMRSIIVNNDIKTHSTFLINDQTQYLNVNDRKYRFYEYAGIFKHVYGDETRFAINKNEYFIEKGFATYRPFFNKLSNLSNYVEKSPEYEIIILPGKEAFSTKNTLQLLLLDLTSKELFNQRIINFITINTVSLKV